LRLQSLLAYVLAGAMIAPAQQIPGPVNRLVDPKETLKIIVIEGEGAKNNIKSRTATAPAVEVRDASDKPVAGAEVVFQLPMAGPSGVFNGWLKTQTVRTDDKGRATTTGYAPNTEAGRFNIKVTATSGAQMGSAVIAQANIEGNGSATAKKSGTWKWVGILGGAAVAGGIVAATRGGNDTAAATPKVPVTITAGSVGVAGPR